MIDHMAEPPSAAYLLLDVAGVPCALAREAVGEVLPLPHLHAPPAAGGPLAGFMNLGGAPVPIVDLARLLGLRDQAEFDPYRHIVLIAEDRLGLLVDRVVDVRRVEPDAVRPTSGGRTLNGCVCAEIDVGDRLVHVLSPGRILTAEEQARLADLTQRAAERLASFGTAA